MSNYIQRTLLPLINLIFGPPVPPQPPEFEKGQIMTLKADYKVGLLKQDYLFVFPTAAVVIHSIDGRLLHIRDGGYLDVSRGIHSYQYIDLREHTDILTVDSKTAEGYDIRLTVAITWKVTNPIRVVGMGDPVQTLLVACKAAIKRTTRTLLHNRLICTEDEELIADKDIALKIYKELSQNQACRAFTIINIDIIERYGDPNVVTIQQTRQLQEKRTQSELDNILQKKRLAEQRRALILTEAEINKEQVELETRLEEMRANFEARRSEIMAHAQVLAAELEALRQQPDRQHEQVLRGMDIRLEAIKALIEAQKAGGFPRNYDDLQLVQQIVANLPSYPSTSNSVVMLSSTLESLMANKSNLLSD